MTELPNVSVHMICDPIPAVPDHALPTGYCFRPYQRGDETTWTYLQRAAETAYIIEDTLFRNQYGSDERALVQRMVFVETHEGTPAGTITAWWQEDWNRRGAWGQIHWVAVHPDHQRRGISKAMMTWAMQRLADWHGRAMLGTATHRIWAVKVYLNFGFCPDPMELEQAEFVAAWRAVQAQLHHPKLAVSLSPA